jgi:hypothetical protein
VVSLDVAAVAGCFDSSVEMRQTSAYVWRLASERQWQRGELRLSAEIVIDGLILWYAMEESTWWLPAALTGEVLAKLVTKHDAVM